MGIQCITQSVMFSAAVSQCTISETVTTKKSNTSKISMPSVSSLTTTTIPTSSTTIATTKPVSDRLSPSLLRHVESHSLTTEPSSIMLELLIHKTVNLFGKT